MKKNLLQLSSFQKLIIFLITLSVGIIAINETQTRHLTVAEEDEDSIEIQESDSDTEVDLQLAENQEQESADLLGISDRKVTVFLDKDGNGNYTQTDSLCDTCVAKSLVAGNRTNGRYPDLKELKTITIASSGSLQESDLLTVNSVWGFFPDRDLAIIPFTVALNDGSSDLYIPARSVKHKISGNNANIAFVNSVDETKILIGFSKLIPSYITAANENSDVWVQLTPDTGKPDFQYLAKSKLTKDDALLTGSSDGYLLEVDFQTKQSLDKLSAEQLYFFLL